MVVEVGVAEGPPPRVAELPAPPDAATADLLSVALTRFFISASRCAAVIGAPADGAEAAAGGGGGGFEGAGCWTPF